MTTLETAQLNRDTYVALMDKFIGEAEFLQNHPPAHVPEEDRIGEHVIARLSPFLKENGGVIELQV